MKEINIETVYAVRTVLEKAGFEIEKAEIEKLSGYMEGVLSWNEKVNLTAIKEPFEFVEKHYADSLAALEIAEFKGARRILDLGTGGGFPGIPLAIMSKEKEFVLMDSLKKRLKIIDELAEELEIANVETVHGRFEDLGRDAEYRGSFDLVLSRAVAEMPVLLEYALPFVKTGKYFAAYKTAGEKLEKELSDSENAVKKLGGKLVRIKKYDKNHAIVIVKKIKDTPSEYPRKAGTPKKNPL